MGVAPVPFGTSPDQSACPLKALLHLLEHPLRRLDEFVDRHVPVLPGELNDERLFPPLTTFEPSLRPPGNLRPSVFILSTQRRRPATMAATTRALPSGVFGPVDMPPWNLHRVLPRTAQLRQIVRSSPPATIRRASISHTPSGLSTRGASMGIAPYHRLDQGIVLASIKPRYAPTRRAISRSSGGSSILPLRLHIRPSTLLIGSLTIMVERRLASLEGRAAGRFC